MHAPDAILTEDDATILDEFSPVPVGEHVRVWSEGPGGVGPDVPDVPRPGRANRLAHVGRSTGRGAANEPG